MALTYNLTDDATTYNIHSKTAYGLLPDGAVNLGRPEQDLVWGVSRQSQFDRLGGMTFRNRIITALIYIRGATHDTWITNYRNLQKMVYEGMRYNNERGKAGARCYLDVAYEGASNVTRYDVLAGTVDAGGAAFSAAMSQATNPIAVGVEISLTCKPFGRPSSSTTVASGALSNNGSTLTINATAIVGDWDPPAKMVWQSANDVKRAIIWGRSKGVVANFKPVLNGEIGSDTGYVVTNILGTSVGTANVVNVADTSAIGASAVDISNNVGTATNLAILQWEIETNNDDFEGDFRVFVRAEAKGVANISGLRLSYGGDSGDAETLPAITSAFADTTYRAIDLGVIHVPVRTAPDSQVLSNLKMRLALSWTGNSTYRVDSLFLVPIDEMLLDAEFSANLSSGDRIISDLLDIRPTLYHTNSASAVQGETMSVFAHSWFKPRVNANNRFGFLAMDTSGNGRMLITDAASMSLEWYPQYAGLR